MQHECTIVAHDIVRRILGEEEGALVSHHAKALAAALVAHFEGHFNVDEPEREQEYRRLFIGGADKWCDVVRDALLGTSLKWKPTASQRQQRVDYIVNPGFVQAAPVGRGSTTLLSVEADLLGLNRATKTTTTTTTTANKDGIDVSTTSGAAKPPASFNIVRTKDGKRIVSTERQALVVSNDSEEDGTVWCNLFASGDAAPPAPQPRKPKAPKPAQQAPTATATVTAAFTAATPNQAHSKPRAAAGSAIDNFWELCTDIDGYQPFPFDMPEPVSPFALSFPPTSQYSVRFVS